MKLSVPSTASSSSQSQRNNLGIIYAVFVVRKSLNSDIIRPLSQTGKEAGVLESSLPGVTLAIPYGLAVRWAQDREFQVVLSSAQAHLKAHIFRVGYGKTQDVVVACTGRCCRMALPSGESFKQRALLFSNALASFRSPGVLGFTDHSPLCQFHVLGPSLAEHFRRDVILPGQYQVKNSSDVVRRLGPIDVLTVLILGPAFE